MDAAESVKWWRLAAKQGSALAEYNLAFAYSTGQGMPHKDTNDAEAVKLFRLAARQDYAKAQERLGWMYETGQGVPQNNVKAYKWCQLSRGLLEPGSRQYKDAGFIMSLAKKSMTYAQLAQAQQEALAWELAHLK